MTDTWSITGIVDARMRLRAEQLYPEWEGPETELEMTVGSFVLRGSDERVVVVDAGAGHAFSVPAKLGTVEESGLLPAGLERAEVSPDEVDAVIFSHLHHDHVAWAGLFPRALYWCHQTEWPAYTDDPRIAEALSPVRSRIQKWSASMNLYPGLRLWHTPGHTPGSACVVVSTETGQTVLVGDVAHHPLEFAAAYSGSGDTDPTLATTSRNTVGTWARAEGAGVRGPHFPDLDLDVDLDQRSPHE